MHSLQILSLQGFVENIIDINDGRPAQPQEKEEPKLLSGEESQALFMSKCQQSIQNSLSVMSNRGMRNEDSQSVFEDNVSLASSKMMVGQMEKLFRSLKLPFINGTKDFKCFPNVGLVQEAEGFNEDLHIRNQEGDLPKENEEIIISNFNNNNSNNVPVSQPMNGIPQSIPNIVENKGPDVPVPPPMNFNSQPIQKNNQQSANKNLIKSDDNKVDERDIQSNNNNCNSNDRNNDSNNDNNKNEDNSAVQEPKEKTMQELLKDQILSRSKTVNQPQTDTVNSQINSRNQSLSSSAQIKLKNDLPLNTTSNPQLKSTKTFNPQPSTEGSKGGINLNQFIKKNLFDDEDDDNEDDLPTNILLRHSGTMRDPNRFPMQNQMIPKIKQDFQKEKKILSGNLFDMNENDDDDDNNSNKPISKITQNKQKGKLLQTKKTMMKIFEDDEVEEKEESIENKVNSITEKTQDLSKKLSQITKAPIEQAKKSNNINSNQDTDQKQGSNIMQQESKKTKDNEKISDKPLKPQIKPQLLKKTTFFDEEEENDESKNKKQEFERKEAIKTNPIVKEQPKQQVVNNPPKSLVNPSKSKTSFFNQEDSGANQTKANEQKKPTAFIKDKDDDAVKKEEQKEIMKPTSNNNNTTIKPNANTSTNNNEEDPITSSPNEKKPIIKSKIKQKEKIEEKPPQIEEPTQNVRQSIQDRIKNMNKEKNQRKESSEQPQIFKSDYGSCRKDIESMLLGRITSTENPFVADNPHSRKATVDEGENNDNNQQENKIDNADEINKEEPPQEEKEKKIVIVQKKKPKKKAFGDAQQEDKPIENESIEVKNESQTILSSTTNNNTNEENKQKRSLSSNDNNIKDMPQQSYQANNKKGNQPEEAQSTPVKQPHLQQQQPNEKEKIDLFSSKQPKGKGQTSIPSSVSFGNETQKVQVEKKHLTNIFDEDDNNQNSSNKIKDQQKENLNSSQPIKQPTNDKGGKLKFLFEED